MAAVIDFVVLSTCSDPLEVFIDYVVFPNPYPFGKFIRKLKLLHCLFELNINGSVQSTNISFVATS